MKKYGGLEGDGRCFEGKTLFYFFFFWGGGGRGIFLIQWAVGFSENVIFCAGDGPSQKCSLFKWDLLE